MFGRARIVPVLGHEGTYTVAMPRPLNEITETAKEVITLKDALELFSQTGEGNALYGCNDVQQYIEGDFYKCGIDHIGFDLSHEEHPDSLLRTGSQKNADIFPVLLEFFKTKKRVAHVTLLSEASKSDECSVYVTWVFERGHAIACLSV
jgi:hypothetical protein